MRSVPSTNSGVLRVFKVGGLEGRRGLEGLEGSGGLGRMRLMGRSLGALEVCEVWCIWRGEGLRCWGGGGVWWVWGFLEREMGDWWVVGRWCNGWLGG